MATVLITGANRGLGLEFAQQYAADGWRVHATCRNPPAAEALGAVTGDVAVHGLDVTDGGSISDLAARLSPEPIDLLINNAGIYGPRGPSYRDVEHAAWAEVMRVNVMAPLAVAAAFVEHVAASERKLMAAISSGLGRIGENSGTGSYIYRTSKAALNQVMKCLALELQDQGVAVVVLRPGWVRTEMGGGEADLSPTESVTGMRRVMDGLTIADTGRFLGLQGEDMPW